MKFKLSHLLLVILSLLGVLAAIEEPHPSEAAPIVAAHQKQVDRSAEDALLESILFVTAPEWLEQPSTKLTEEETQELVHVYNHYIQKGKSIPTERLTRIRNILSLPYTHHYKTLLDALQHKLQHDSDILRYKETYAQSPFGNGKWWVILDTKLEPQKWLECKAPESTHSWQLTEKLESKYSTHKKTITVPLEKACYYSRFSPPNEKQLPYLKQYLKLRNSGKATPKLTSELLSQAGIPDTFHAVFADREAVIYDTNRDLITVKMQNAYKEVGFSIAPQKHIFIIPKHPSRGYEGPEDATTIQYDDLYKQQTVDLKLTSFIQYNRKKKSYTAYYVHHGTYYMKKSYNDKAQKIEPKKFETESKSTKTLCLRYHTDAKPISTSNKLSTLWKHIAQPQYLTTTLSTLSLLTSLWLFRQSRYHLSERHNDPDQPDDPIIRYITNPALQKEIKKLRRKNNTLNYRVSELNRLLDNIPQERRIHIKSKQERINNSSSISLHSTNDYPGIENFGQTCYLNSYFQAFSPLLSKYIGHEKDHLLAQVDQIERFVDKQQAQETLENLKKNVKDLSLQENNDLQELVQQDLKLEELKINQVQKAQQASNDITSTLHDVSKKVTLILPIVKQQDQIARFHDKKEKIKQNLNAIIEMLPNMSGQFNKIGILAIEKNIAEIIDKLNTNKQSEFAIVLKKIEYLKKDLLKIFKIQNNSIKEIKKEVTSSESLFDIHKAILKTKPLLGLTLDNKQHNKTKKELLKLQSIKNQRKGFESNKKSMLSFLQYLQGISAETNEQILLIFKSSAQLIKTMPFAALEKSFTQKSNRVEKVVYQEFFALLRKYDIGSKELDTLKTHEVLQAGDVTLQEIVDKKRTNQQFNQKITEIKDLLNKQFKDELAKNLKPDSGLEKRLKELQKRVISKQEVQKKIVKEMQIITDWVSTNDVNTLKDKINKAIKAIKKELPQQKNKVVDNDDTKYDDNSSSNEDNDKKESNKQPKDQLSEVIESMNIGNNEKNVTAIKERLKQNASKLKEALTKYDLEGVRLINDIDKKLIPIAQKKKNSKSKEIAELNKKINAKNLTEEEKESILNGINEGIKRLDNNAKRNKNELGIIQYLTPDKNLSNEDINKVKLLGSKKAAELNGNDIKLLKQLQVGKLSPQMKTKKKDLEYLDQLIDILKEFKKYFLGEKEIFKDVKTKLKNFSETLKASFMGDDENKFLPIIAYFLKQDIQAVLDYLNPDKNNHKLQKKTITNITDIVGTFSNSDNFKLGTQHDSKEILGDIHDILNIPRPAKEEETLVFENLQKEFELGETLENTPEVPQKAESNHMLKIVVNKDTKEETFISSIQKRLKKKKPTAEDRTIHIKHLFRKEEFDQNKKKQENKFLDSLKQYQLNIEKDNKNALNNAIDACIALGIGKNKGNKQREFVENLIQSGKIKESGGEMHLVLSKNGVKEYHTWKTNKNSFYIPIHMTRRVNEEFIHGSRENAKQKKIKTLIYPDEYLQLKKEESNNADTYELKGLVLHSGSVGSKGGSSGHYIACVKKSKKWYRISDSDVRLIGDGNYGNLRQYLFEQKSNFQILLCNYENIPTFSQKED